MSDHTHPGFKALNEQIAELEAEKARLQGVVDETLRWCDLNPEWYAWVVAENLRAALEGGETDEPPTDEGVPSGTYC